MTVLDSNLRKAAVLLRSLDGETAAVMLAQLSPAEADSLRAAIRTIGAVDPEEQADVVSEFRRTRPTAAIGHNLGVELELSAQHNGSEAGFDGPLTSSTHSGSAKRF